jgi:hypothetical protein
MAFLQPSEWVACAVVCRQWNPVALNSRAWIGWTFRSSTYKSLSRIPQLHRASLGRLEYVFNRQLPEEETDALRRLMRDFTGLDHIGCAGTKFLRLILDAQAGGPATDRPITSLHLEFGRDVSLLQGHVTNKADAALLSHPRLAGLEVLRVFTEWKIADDFLHAIETSFPRLREISVPRMTKQMSGMLQRRPSITSLTVGLLPRQTAEALVLPAWITSFTGLGVHLTVSIFAQAVHLRHLELLTTDGDQSSLIARIIQLEHLETLRLESRGFSLAELTDLVERNRSHLRWHHARLVLWSGGCDQVHMVRYPCARRPPRTVVVWWAEMLPKVTACVGALTGVWDVLVTPIPEHDAFWERIHQAAPGLQELRLKQQIRPFGNITCSIHPLAKFRWLRCVTVEPHPVADRRSFSIEMASILAQLPQLEELVCIQNALVLSDAVIRQLARSSSLRLLSLKQHSQTTIARWMQTDQKLCRLLVQLRPQVMVIYNGESSTAVASN